RDQQADQYGRSNGCLDHHGRHPAGRAVVSGRAVHLEAPAPQEEHEGEHDQPREHQAEPVSPRVDAHVVDLGREVAGETYAAAARTGRRESDAPHGRLLPDEYPPDRLAARVVDAGTGVIAGLEGPTHRVLQHQVVRVALLDWGARRVDRGERTLRAFQDGRWSIRLLRQIERPVPGLMQLRERLEVGRAAARPFVDPVSHVFELAAQRLPGAFQGIYRRRTEAGVQEIAG